MNAKLLFDGETFDFEEIDRRKQPNEKFLKVYPGEVVRVIDTCEGNAKQFANKTITAFCWSFNQNSIIHWQTQRKNTQSLGGCVFSYDPRERESEAMPLACIKTKARQALERIGGNQ